MTISLDPGRATLRRFGAEPRHVVTAAANFHRPLDAYPADEMAASFLGRAKKDWEFFGRIILELLGAEVAPRA